MAFFKPLFFFFFFFLGGPEDEEDLEAICTQYSVVQGSLSFLFLFRFSLFSFLLLTPLSTPKTTGFSEPTFGYGGGWEEEEEEEWGGDLGVVDEVVDAFDRLMAKEPYSAYESVCCCCLLLLFVCLFVCVCLCLCYCFLFHCHSLFYRLTFFL